MAADRWAGAPGRCHPAERSLFLQPYVDALRPVLLGAGAPRSPPARRARAAWVSLLPELAGSSRRPRAARRPRPAAPGGYDAVAAVLRRLARHPAGAAALDDLQDAGAATVDLLGYLAGRLAAPRVLLVAAVRSRGRRASPTTRRPAARASALGALPRSAVEALAAAPGLAEHAGR